MARNFGWLSRNRIVLLMTSSRASLPEYDSSFFMVAVLGANRCGNGFVNSNDRHRRSFPRLLRYCLQALETRRHRLEWMVVSWGLEESSGRLTRDLKSQRSGRFAERFPGDF